SASACSSSSRIAPVRGSAGPLVHRPLDLRLELDVAPQEVVVFLAEQLRVATLARLGAPCLGELVEPTEQLRGLFERFEDRARAGGIDELDVTAIARPAEREHDGIRRLVAERLGDGAHR